MGMYLIYKLFLCPINNERETKNEDKKKIIYSISNGKYINKPLIEHYKQILDLDNETIITDRSIKKAYELRSAELPGNEIVAVDQLELLAAKLYLLDRLAWVTGYN